ncbi:hypothetical protein A2Y85_01055 [candidate division WOR-3 bacterium RBG_13_43_14]|uniref:Outer membrane protein beta-barrel domain-containing protein n=1 Tax=candidate division WOR-3 bacterium RBG_13_43_14 TaxID=1802590 RepID=A0A1F4UAE1_UNCW3|nr:MAG: hypothetical protein A2Y85_01055 [candidate division WOR-3 bacterium RBG_13_43_14]
MFNKIITSLLIILVTGLAYAARPFFTDDAGTVEAGIHELEFGLDYWPDNSAVSVSFKHGLTNRMDIGIGFGHIFEPDEINGFTSLEIGLKYVLLTDLLAASVVVNPGDPSYVFNGILSHGFGPFCINLNTGYTVTTMPDDNSSIIYALGILYDFPRFTVGLEASGNDDNLDTWQIGGNICLIPALRFDLGLSGGFEDIGDSMLMTGGLHYEF